MKQLWKIMAVLCCMAMLLTLSACGETPAAPTVTPTESTAAPTTEPTTVPTEPAPTQEELAAIYTNAVAALGTEAVGMDITVSQTMTVAGQVFTSESTQKVSYWNLGGENYLAKISDTTAYGDYKATVEEIYGGGNVYQALNKLNYTSAMTAEDFASRYAPVQLLDPTLYTVSVDEAGTTVTFSDATAGESWMMSEDAVLNSASATAAIGEDGKLASTTYTVDYTYGPAQYVTTYTVTYTDAGKQPTLPEDTTGYTVLEDIDAIWLLEHAYGYLNQAKQVSVSVLDTIQSEAAGFVLNQQIDINSYVTDAGTDYRIENGVFTMSASGSTESEMDEKFIGGKYSACTDGGREEYNAAVTDAVMENYTRGELTANILTANYITGGTITDVGGLYLIEYTFTEDMGASMCDTISQTLFGSDLLDELASKYVTNTMEYYLALDKYSMLPTAAGLKYEGCHTIDRQKCLLIQQIDQAFDLASLSSYEAIYEETAPDAEPENKPTPLFYHVTGADGQEMWLFGTIHIGDDRTGYLPHQITDALLSSDALAVECDTETFYDSLEDDEELSKQVSEAYYYSDSTVSEHLDTEDLYEDAVKLMKATGNYNFNSEYLKAYLWGNSIDNFYLRQGYQLTSDKGVESRLEKIAEDNDIPLWEVESTMFQIQMSTGFSEYLQEFLLYSSVYSGDFAWEGSTELYELWCSGDEAALIERIANEPWTIEEEDLADTEGMDEEDLQRRQNILDNLESINAELVKLQEEYNTAMESSRNAGMLEVAKEYLESDDVVFYAVGLAHLLAEDGLVNTLRAAGYTVELVTFGE